MLSLKSTFRGVFSKNRKNAQRWSGEKNSDHMYLVTGPPTAFATRKYGEISLFFKNINNVLWPGGRNGRLGGSKIGFLRCKIGPARTR